MIPLTSKKRKLANEGKEKKYKYSEFEPLHSLWLKYIREVIGNAQQLETFKQKTQCCFTFLKADLHGASITVVQSSCPSLIGKSGIVVVETKNVFKIVSKEDKILFIPKNCCVFTLAVEKMVFTLQGKHFLSRPYERVSKKFVVKPFEPL